MPRRNRQARTANELLATTTQASASVIAARAMAFSDPATLFSPWQQAEARRMVTEKVTAAGDGMLAASFELAALPWRMLQLVTSPSAWTPSRWMQLCMAGAGVWIGVGNAALRPARNTAVRNRKRLAPRGG